MCSANPNLSEMFQKLNTNFEKKMNEKSRRLLARHRHDHLYLALYKLQFSRSYSL